MKFLLIFLFCSFVISQNNGSLSFDGGDDAQELIANYQGSDNAGTFSVWFKPTNYTSTRTLINISDAASLARYLIMDIQTSGVVMLQYRYDATRNRITSTNTVNVGKWNHVIFKSTGSAYQIILNGVDETLIVVEGADNGLWLNDMANMDNIVLGLLRRSDSDYNYYLGLMDELAYFDAATTTAQDATLYNSGTPKSLGGMVNLVDNWRFEEGTGTTTDDEDDDNTFTFGAGGAAPSWSTDTPGWISETAKAYPLTPLYPLYPGWK